MAAAASPARAGCRVESRTGHRARGSALVIVLLFVILLTGLTIAFLSRSLTAARVSSSSAGETKASILANSAGDIVIGDFKQEIIAGSAKATGWKANWPVYSPNSNATMVPFQNGVPASPLTIPNLVSRSVSASNTGGTNPYKAYPTGATLYTAASVPPSRAALDSSASGAFAGSKVSSAAPSLNGRSVSVAQWNAPYLIPSAQLASFVPPDWVVVTRAGANAVNWSSGSGGLNDPTVTNNNYAVGRYAYAVYNEGGLLDMNVAGYPSGLTTAQTSNKSSLALADLTQVGLTQSQIDNIIGWRNYATAELSGSFGNFSPFTATAAGNWLTNFVLGNTNGYLQITPAPSGVTTPPTDQAFVSRQQLISLAQSLGIGTDSLSCLGTFSRALEQPSFTPDPNRPKIVNPGSAPPAANNVTSYMGNNDEAGNDASTSVAVNPNPAFLNVRVTSSFTRLNGTTAVAGEPLVKYKFALSRLAMVAYNATNTSAAAAFGTAADPDPIFDRFGLKRTSSSSPWVYNHGANKILKLGQVAQAKREPDFAELLKAAIAAGSVAKGGPTLHNNQGNEQYAFDTTSDLQILQIMANLIDQQDSDSFPTCIQLNDATTLSANVVVSGVEDLPYMYRYHLFTVVDKLPAPLLSQSASVTFPAVPSGTTVLGSTPTSTTYPTGTQQTGNWTVANGTAVTITGCAAGNLSNPGDVTFMYIPGLWNPHDSNTMAGETSSLRPTQFRISMLSEDPLALTNPWEMVLENRLTSNGLPTTGFFPETDPNNSANYFWPISGGTSAPQKYTAPGSNNSMTFSDNGGLLFREPTLLWNGNPTGINIGGTHVVEANTGRTYYGLIAAQGPISTQFSITSTPAQATDGNYVVQAANQAGTIWNLDYLPGSAGTSFDQFTFVLQYQDAAGNWITYDVKYPDLHSQGPGTAIVNIADDPGQTYQSPLRNNQISANDVVFDPRTARFGVGITSQLGNVPRANGIAYTLEPLANSTFFDNSPAGLTKMGNTLFTVFETDRPRVDPGDQVYYSNPCMTFDPGQNLQMRWFGGPEYRASSGTGTSPVEYDGLFSQNNPAIQSTILSQNGAATQQLFYEDPDGVARRATGAYADTTLAGSTVGLPLATANTFNNNAVGTTNAQSQSRPLILNRPFRSVAEMSYAFSGTPWKNIDFFTPESGSSALLDVFCVNDPPPSGVVAGKVDLNTRNAGVLQAVVSGAYVDEVANSSAAPPGYALPPLTSTEAANVAGKLISITSDTAHAWRGPLQNVAGLAGRFIATPGTVSGTDYYAYTPPSPVSGQLTSAIYAGLSATLDSSVYANAATPLIQRFRESAIRPLAACGQVRVWNLLIDVVAQTGRYPRTADGLDQFVVDGQRRLWIHVAIDRYTGQVIDKQVEVVAQ